MPGYDLRADATVGRWVLAEPLGKGGNAEVWRARSGDDGDVEEVALKVLIQRRGERLERFRNEHHELLLLADDPGVLPMVDAFVPENLGGERAWIAFPIATEIRDALDGAGVPAIVEALRAIAETLARAHARGRAHRDIKPDNLYRLHDHWLIGDWGLVQVPDRSDRDLTTGRLGPFGYMPDEMFADARGAAGGPVDVFEVAKTLWALVTGDAFPPQGQIAAAGDAALERFNDTPRVPELDDLIERCTRRPPDRRPTMLQVVAELTAWLETPHPAREGNAISALTARFRHANRDALDIQDVQLRRRARFAPLEDHAREALNEVADALRVVGLHPEMTMFHDGLQAWIERGGHDGAPAGVEEWASWVVARLDDGTSMPRGIAIGIGLELTEDGDLWSVCDSFWGNFETTAFEQCRGSETAVQIESLEARAAIQRLRDECLERAVLAIAGLAG